MADIHNAGSASHDESPVLPGDVIPIVAMRNVALLPGTVVPITLGREESLAAAQEAAKSFAPKPQPAEATMVPQPSGGWDRATSPPPEKPRAAGPLSISAFSSGKL